MRITFCSLLLLPLLEVAGKDPAGSWLSYARWTDPRDGRITALNTTWVVPSNPKSSWGSNAPGWWFGVQTAEGDGALIQPILAYGYEGEKYSIFNAVFDWTDGSWQTSDDVYTVEPGATVTSSIVYRADDNSYLMSIASGDKTITMPYALKAGQTKNESTAYFVLEHQPLRCQAYPENGNMTFASIYLEVDGQAVASPQWEAEQERPACESKCKVIDPARIQFTWNANAASKRADGGWTVPGAPAGEAEAAGGPGGLALPYNNMVGAGPGAGPGGPPAPAKWGRGRHSRYSPPEVGRICVSNSAGFVLHFDARDLDTDQVSADSGTYPVDQTRCLDLGDVAHIAKDDLVMCRIHADAGETKDCEDAVKYVPNSTETATFTCRGTTLDYDCRLN